MPTPDPTLPPSAEPAEPSSHNPSSTPGATAVFAVGDYLVGDAEDEMLSGHPDIRY